MWDGSLNKANEISPAWIITKLNMIFIFLLLQVDFTTKNTSVKMSSDSRSGNSNCKGQSGGLLQKYA